jgi:hypothetical protein
VRGLNPLRDVAEFIESKAVPYDVPWLASARAPGEGDEQQRVSNRTQEAKGIGPTLYPLQTKRIGPKRVTAI